MTTPEQQMQRLASKVAALEQLLDVFERTVLDQTEKLEHTLEVLRAATAAAEAASRAKSDFLAQMSHELRTPLNSVIGFSNAMLSNSDGHFTPRDVDFLERIHRNGHHLLGVINTILDLAKVEAGHIEVKREPVQLGELIQETVDLLKPDADGRPVQLRAELPSGMETLSTDRLKLRQILINLLGNALRFTDEGSVTVSVVAAGPSRRPVRIDVTDTGIGILADKTETIFEAFQQVDGGRSRRYAGTGLGLAIARSFAELLGYRLEVASSVGAGSTFSILLEAPSS